MAREAACAGGSPEGRTGDLDPGPSLALTHGVALSKLPTPLGPVPGGENSQGRVVRLLCSTYPMRI